jgi:hypothetical protein
MRLLSVRFWEKALHPQLHGLGPAYAKMLQHHARVWLPSPGYYEAREGYPLIGLMACDLPTWSRIETRLKLVVQRATLASQESNWNA